MHNFKEMIFNLIYNVIRLWCSPILFFCRPILDFIDFLAESKSSNNVNNKETASYSSFNSLLNNNGYSSSVRHGKKRRRQQFNNTSSCNIRRLTEEQRRKLINNPMRIQSRQNTIISSTKLSTKRISPGISVMNKSKYIMIKTTIHHLPIELLLCIFEQLPNRKDFYNCLFVCKSWNYLVIPFLYKSLQICPLPQNFPIEKFGHYIKVLDFSSSSYDKVDKVTDVLIQTIAKACPRLRCINLNGCKHLSDSSLEAISKNSCSSSLLSINLSGCRKITDVGLKHLSKSCHYLTSLNVADCGKISDKGVIHIAKGCPGLRQLRLSDCPRVTEQSIEFLVQNCNKLCWLDIARIGRITDSSVRVIANSCKENLERLNLARPSPLEVLYSSALASPSLLPITYIDDISFDGDDVDHDVIRNVRSDTEITDASIALLTKQCPNLQLLDLSYMNSITNCSIESIANNSFSLVCLTIIGCRFVTCDSLRYLAQLRRKSGHLGCITMGDAAGITEKDIESITNEPEGLLSGWQKSSVDEDSLKEILGGVSWDDVGSW
jgi:F-box and leucine-rich repeat protein GRR1